MELRGLIGLAVILALGAVLSTNRARIPWHMVAIGIGLQAILAAMLLKSPTSVSIVRLAAGTIIHITHFASDGSRLLLGDLAAKDVFAFSVLPVIVFSSALISMLFYLGVLPRLILASAWLFRRVFGRSLSGCEALVGAANLFLAQTEAPLCIKPLVASLTQSQLMTVMTCGFATMAASVLPIYARFLANAAGGPKRAMSYLLVATVMSIPAAIVMAKVMVPEDAEAAVGDPLTLSVLQSSSTTGRTLLDAAATGASAGMRLAANVCAMLLAIVALLAMVDWLIANIGATLGLGSWQLADILGVLLRPVAWMLGVDSKDCQQAGAFIGREIVETEFLTYLHLGTAAAGQLSHHSFVILLFALASFANIPSIAIQIGGLSAVAPARQGDIAHLAPRAMCAGILASWMTACIVGLVLGPLNL